LIEYWIK